MKVLLLATDLYRDIGGGQTVYRKIIESAPGIEFVYFRQHESQDAGRPGNARAVQLAARQKLKVRAAPPFASYRRAQLVLANRFARTVAGQRFDIVDVPDYYAFGGLLADAFARHEVHAGRIVLAMHGNISVSMQMAWDGSADESLEQRMLERDQFEAADAAYAISPRYIRQWRAIVERPVHFIDPLCFVDPGSPVAAHPPRPASRPNLYCIGRTERRKGNDLFVELVRWIDRLAYGQAVHIGDEISTRSGRTSRQLLADLAKERGVEIAYRPSVTRTEMSQLLSERAVVVLPVRYDTLNLVALEALLEGCPVAVSSEAGVCDYLDQYLPGLPYVKIDFSDFYSAVAQINDLLQHHDEHRERLAAYLKSNAPRLAHQLDMAAVYARMLADNSAATRSPRKPILYRELGEPWEDRADRLAKRLLPPGSYRTIVRFLDRPWQFITRRLLDSDYFPDARLLYHLIDASRIPTRFRRIASHPERSVAHLRAKLGRIYEACGNPLYRCNFWLDIARIERELGNDLVAAAYELRVLRLLGRDEFSLLPRVERTLRSNGFAEEANSAIAMYAAPQLAAERVHALLTRRYEEQLCKPAQDFADLVDRRAGEPKVAVIVSLYKAASKLRFFLRTLSEQTLVKKGQVEVILIDSGSPDDEARVLTEFLDEIPMNVVYARSAERETIQSAWNRGIALARAPYLVFLGVDETLYPEALEQLSAELDWDKSADWVMANSLVTRVDEHGVYRDTVMTYDRTGGTKDHAYLETCYVSWVGGMYRRSIHDRFGYYDESFRAAGDTEFKNRVLPHINVRFVPRTLGLFLNYPDERTTESPVAEIEDLRAWYIHRTAGGVRYAFERRSPADAERLMYVALGYRKSFCRHASSDVEYAGALAAFLAGLGTRKTVEALKPGLEQALQSMRTLEFVAEPPSRSASMRSLVAAWRTARRLQRDHDATLRGVGAPAYKILNDNRMEQHSWLWRTTDRV